MSQQQQQWQRPLQLQIDYNQAVWQSYLNCVNSFQLADFESRMAQGASIATSSVSPDRFVYNVQVLYSQIKDKDREKATITGLSVDEGNVFEVFHKIVEGLHDLGFFKSPRRLAHL